MDRALLLGVLRHITRVGFSPDGGESHVMWVVLTRSRTQGGIFTTPGDAYTTPVDMWVKALGEPFFFHPRNQIPVLKK